MPEELPARASGSPGVCGYALAVAVSLVVFAALLAAPDGTPGFAWSDFARTFLLVVLVGALPAAIIGAVGSLIVHCATWCTAAQRWHVLAAAVVGLVAGGISSGGSLMWGVALGVATGVGRVAVIPLAMRRSSEAAGAG